jgi:2-(1,2-epoxy-1,2-dihydrophenyl)acetyl-CoA isomerase
VSDFLHDRVRYGVEDTVATMTLARPDAGNGFDLAMARAINTAAQRIAVGAHTGEIRAAVVAAEGKVFSVGGDLRHFADAKDPGDEMRHVAGGLHEALSALVNAPLPVITAVHGVAAGGGVGLALAGDIVLAGPRAKFRLAYTAGGLSPDCGTSWLLPQRIGAARALDLALTNRPVDAQEAAAWGMVSRLMDSDDVAGEAQKLAAELAGGASGALAQAKRLIRTADTRTFADSLDDEAHTITRLVTGPEASEGIDAFLTKRTPKYV